MRVLVTGANGFVGIPTCRALQAAGFEVRALLRMGGDPEALDALGIPHFEGDVTVPGSLGQPLEGIDTVVHLAGVKQAARSSTYRRVNSDGTGHLASAAKEAGVERFVFISSIAAQGPSAPGFPHCKAGGEAPTNPYSRSKLAAEKALLEAGLELPTILRPSLVFGPGDPHILWWAKMIRRRIVPMVADLEISFLHVEDLAALIVKVVQHPEPLPGPYFVCSGKPLPMAALIDQLEQHIASGPVLRIPLTARRLRRWAPLFEKIARATSLGSLAGRRLSELAASGWACDGSAANEAFDFSPKHQPLPGLRSTLDAFRSDGTLG